MIVNTVTEAKANLSVLLERVSRGEEVIIQRTGKPIAVLEPYTKERQPRVPGRLKGKIRVAKDFDKLPAELAKAFGVPLS